VKGELKQDNVGQWWYYFPCGTRKQYYERTCFDCGKIDIVDKKHINKKCKSCTYIGTKLPEETKNKISKAHIGLKLDEKTKLKMSIDRKGNKHPRFKGRVNNMQGYINIFKPDHPCATKKGYVLEHRLVMEDMIGRHLTSKEVVHHINGVKDDNRETNLWLFKNNKEHMRFHRDIDLSSKKSNYIYLAGTISSNPITYEWREKFEILTREERLYKKVVTVNPCRNKYNQNIKNFKSNGLEFLKEVKSRSQQILRAKDKQLLGMCNVMLMDLSIYDKDKPHIGTLHELVWAHDIFYMPVISIVGSDSDSHNNPYSTHPWIDECCSAKVETVEEAADMIKTFFLEY